MRSLLFALLTCTLLGCQNSNSSTHSHNDPINVVCTTGMVADLARIIGGPQVAVTQIMADGVDPHLYKATPGDMRLMSNAQVIFYSGHHLEGKMTDALHALAKKMPAVAVAEAIDEGKILKTEDGIADPHLWFDVSLWSQAAQAVGDTLAKHDPKHAADYEGRTKSYRAELARLHEEVREQIAAVPTPQRVMITSHDAFRYFGRAYGIEVRGIQGISTEAEASVKDINELVRFLTERKVKAVFVETSVNPRNMEALLQGCQAQGHTVVQGGELFSDAMGKEGTPTGTYIGMIRHNVETVVKALR